MGHEISTAGGAGRVRQGIGGGGGGGGGMKCLYSVK